MRNKTKIIITLIFVFQILFVLAAFAHPAQADGSFLCNPEDNALGSCINRIYTISIVAASIGAVFMIVLAGYMYMFSGGSESRTHEAKSFIASSIGGLAILLTGLLILNQINPDLLKLKSIAPEGISAREWILPDGTVIVSATKPPGASPKVSYGGRTCNPITNNASPGSIDNLTGSCFGKYGAEVVKQASIVASRESGGNPSLPVGAGSCGAGKPAARCAGGEIPVWGLYQINLIAHKVEGLDCPSAFRNANGGRHDGSFCRTGNQCVVVNQDLYNRCAEAARSATANTNTACSIYQRNISARRPGFNDWGNQQNEHGKKCGF